jgi:hypothetical protein
MSQWRKRIVSYRRTRFLYCLLDAAQRPIVEAREVNMRGRRIGIDLEGSPKALFSLLPLSAAREGGSQRAMCFREERIQPNRRFCRRLGFL